MRWTVRLDGGPKRVNHAAVCIGDRIFSFGGYCTGDDYSSPRPIDVHMLNTVNIRWVLLPLPTQREELRATPYQRYGHTAVEYEDNAYVWGGRNDVSGPCNILYRFSGASRKWSRVATKGKIPEARDGHSACVINHRMYIFAGYEETANRFSNDMNYVDLRNFSWVRLRTKGEPAQWRDFHTATAVGNMMYIFGGRLDEGGEEFTNQDFYCNKLMAFDTTSNIWIEPSISPKEMPVGRRSHSAFAHNGNLYIFGGYNGKLGIHFNDMHVFNFASMQWTRIKMGGRYPPPCRRQGCCMVSSKVFLFGGTSPKSLEPSPRNNENIMADEEDESDLVDRADMNICDLDPSLKTLASIVIIENELDCTYLPHDLRWELAAMTTHNKITPTSQTMSCELKGISPL